MFCQECGGKNSDDAVYCEHCGAKLEREEPAAAVNAQQAAPFVEPVQAGMAPDNAAPGDTAAVKPGKGITKWTKILILEAAILLAAGYMLFTVGEQSFTAQNTALTFFIHMANGDYNAAYAQLDLEESAFINADMFAKANEEYSLGAVSNYHVDNSKNDFGLGLSNMLSALGETVNIAYRTRGGTEDKIYSVNLSKQADKKYLLFDDWKVGVDGENGIISTDYSIIVPKGADVCFDGIVLDEGYLQSGGTEYGNEMICYKIPQVFNGKHSVWVSMENREDVTDHVEIRYDQDQYAVWDMVWTQDAMNAMIQKAKTDMQQLYQAAMEGQEFESISGIFSAKQEYAETLRDQYNSLVDMWKDGNSSRVMQEVYFYNMTGTVSSQTESAVELYGSYDAVYEYTDWWGDKETERYQDMSYNGSVSFELEDGNWVLTSFWL